MFEGQYAKEEVTQMAVSMTKRRFTVDEYYTMARSGILREGDRVELIEGEITQMIPIGSRHIIGVNCVVNCFVTLQVEKKAILSVQNPLRLDDYTEPEPDVVLLEHRAEFLKNQMYGPADVLLIVEVSDTSLIYDRDVKGPLYARFGIPELWLADVEGKTVTVYRTPSPRGYEEMKTFRAGQTLSPLAFPELTISVQDILG